MIKQILIGMGAAAGVGGLGAVVNYKPQAVPVVAVKPAVSMAPAAATATPKASSTPPPTPIHTAAATIAPAATPKAGVVATPTPTPAPTHTPTPTPPPTPSGQYKDGTYSGSTVQVGYGTTDTTVQVQVVVSGGKITGVSFLHYPKGDAQTNTNSTHVRNTMPSETIAAQVANVQVVSGATMTSDAYISSMTVALQAAHV